MTSQPKSPLSERRLLVEAVVASTIGTTIEWYDFFLYGLASASFFPRLFFPAQDPFLAKMLSFGSFTVGFLARPVGGVVFGYLGDRVGRKSTLVATLLLMGVSTFLIGCLPTHARIGVAAPILLTVLRVIQGFGVGGEWGGAVLLALEYGHRRRRAFYASWPQAGVPLGLLLASLVLYFCESRLSPEAFDAWGWRIPFLLSGLLIAVGLLIRTRILETPLFRTLQEKKQLAEAPVRETVRRHWRDILLAGGTRLNENASFYIFAIYFVTYGRATLGLSPSLVSLAVNLAAAAEFVTIPLYGLLADRLPRRRSYSLGCILLLIFAYPYYLLLNSGSPWLVITAAVLSLAAVHALLYSVQASLIPELFSTRLRYTGASLGYQLATPFAGGLAPHIAAWIEHLIPGQPWPLAAYLMVISLISWRCVNALAETSRKDLSKPD